jgi:hypothetical protein
MNWPANMITEQATTVDVETFTRLIKEACDDYEPGWNTVARGNAPATYSGGPISMTRTMARIADRADGKFFPFYETELDLIRERNKWRKLAAFTSVAIGAMTALQCYTMGGEWEYEIEAKKGYDPPPELIAEAQKILDAILEKNNFVGGLDNEIHDFSREDGECPVAVYACHDGIPLLRRLEADNIREPLSKTMLNDWLYTPDKHASWTFGVFTRFDEHQQRIDHERHIGYNVVFDDSGSEWDYLPAWPQNTGDHELDGKCMQLIRRNVPRSAKRGVSDYWPVLIDLEQESKLNINTNVGLAVQAAIAWWEEMPPNANKQQVESQISAALDSFSQRVTNSRNSGERPINNMKPGTVPKISAGRKIIAGPMGQQRSPLFLEGRNAIMRRIGLRWLMPEYMITGDASNSNFASTLVAESPFVKARESDQRVYVTHFKELFTKALKIAFDEGRFDRWVRSWHDFTRQLDLRIQPPMVATRDKAAQMDELFGLWDRGVIDSNELRVETRREEKPELVGKTGDPNAQPGIGANPMLGGAGAVGRLPAPIPGTISATRLSSIEGAIRKCKTIEEARALVRNAE